MSVIPNSSNNQVMVFIEKNSDDRLSHFPYYVIQCQRKNLLKHINVLHSMYPNMRMIEPECEDANALHCWNRFKKENLTRDHFHRNHFRLPNEELSELFEDLFVTLT